MTRPKTRIINIGGWRRSPPAFGLAGVNLHNWTGWGSVTYWNGPRV